MDDIIVGVVTAVVLLGVTFVIVLLLYQDGEDEGVPHPGELETLTRMSIRISGNEARRILNHKHHWLRFLPTYFPKDKQHPIAGKDRSVRDDGKIFVSIASYRDSELLPTVRSLLENSANPKNLVVCICLQEDEANLLSLPPRLAHIVEDVYHAQMKLLSLSYKDARGPTWPRYLIQNEWNGEQYYLQIDSHMRFTPSWDLAMIHSLSLCPSKKKCLTNYVSLYDQASGKRDDRHRDPLKVVRVDQGDGLFRFNSQFTTSPSSRPKKGYCWAGCFSFSRASIIHDAPYDPYTPYLFFGEETDISARLHAAGWAFYAPEKHICYTTFVRSYRPLFWVEHPYQKLIEPLSRLRLYYRLGVIPQDIIHQVPDELLTDTMPYHLGLRDYTKYTIAAQRYRYTPSTTH